MSRARSIAAVVALASSSRALAVPLQDALDPAGPQAQHLVALWDLMLAMSTVVFVLLVGAAWIAVLRRTRREIETPDLAHSEQEHRRLTRIVSAAVIVSALGLAALVIATIATDRALAGLPLQDALHIELTGHQWWWEASYDNADPSKVFTTANEIHIPVGRAIKLELSSQDVIHSFWVPSLHGKRDLIPGHDTTLWIEADRPGVYRGFCAEFCGHQHAHMGLLVIADPPDRYDTWYAAQLQPPPPPASPLQQRGRQMVESAPCAVCHTIQGSQATGRLGPDLTHLASRRTIAAATLPNTRENLIGWIRDPQTPKPGCQMPACSLSAADLEAVQAYLESLR
jgi:cytochrome c oxidase subunit 2